MKRILATVVIAAIGTTVVGAGSALAAEIEVSPATPGAGPSELTIDVVQFSPETPIYALPCAIPDTGGDLDFSTEKCDISAVAATTTDADGAATIVVDWAIPAEGLAVYVSNEARTDQAFQLVTPADDAGDATNGVEVLGTSVVEGAQETPAQEAPAQENDLADTGASEVMILVMVATALIGLGIALRGVERLQTAPVRNSRR